MFGLGGKIKIILLFNLFLLLFTSLILLFDTIHDTTVLWQLNFTFIYNNFNNNFLILVK